MKDLPKEAQNKNIKILTPIEYESKGKDFSII